MEIPCTGVILAGGQNSRMLQKNKAFISVAGKRFIDTIVDVYRLFFDEIILVTNDPSEYYDLDVKIVTDIYKKRCSLTGIHTGLFHASHPWVFVVPCDLPFLSKEMVQLILSQIHPRYSIVIPETAMGLEPLCALYSKENLSRIETSLENDRLKIQSFFKPKLMRKISEKRLRAVDPDLRSFFNVNSPADLEKAVQMITETGKEYEFE